jgi:hypothetical protein
MTTTANGGGVKCPDCGSTELYDNRQENEDRKRRGEKPRPAFKCKDANCGGAIWSTKKASQRPAKAPESREHSYGPLLPGESPEEATGGNAPAPSPVPKAKPPTLCADYLAAVDFVLDKVAPRFAKAGIPLTNEAAAAAVATVFTAKSRRG